MIRLFLIFLMFLFIGFLGMVSGFFAFDHEPNRCVSATIKHTGWANLFEIKSVELRWPEFTRHCTERMNPQTKQFYPVSE